MKRWTFSAVVLLVASLVCAGITGSAEPDTKDAFSLSCPGGNSGTYFFPRGIFEKDRPDIDEFVRCWYSWQLAVMEEPSLSRDGKEDEVSYRFLWLRSFHSPVAVRINRSGNQVRLVAIELSRRAGGYEPEAIGRRQSLMLTPQDWGRLESALDSAQFWAALATTERTGLDGASWIIEGRKQNNYHMVKRWSPEPEDEFQKLGLLFLELSGWSGSLEPVY